MLQQRANLIKSELAKYGIKQNKIAVELDVTPNAIYYWIQGKFSSKRITDWFGKEFGDNFLEQIEIH